MDPLHNEPEQAETPLAVLPQTDATHPSTDTSAALVPYPTPLAPTSALRKNYEALVHAIGGLLWEANAESLQFTFVDPQAEPLLGYSVQQWSAPHFWLDHLYPDDREQVIAACQEALRGQQQVEIEYRMAAADGRFVWLKAIATVVLEADRPTLLHGVMLDISHQKQVKETLESQQIQLENALKIGQMGSWDWDLRTNQVLCSQGLSQILDLPPTLKTCFYNRLTAAIHPDDRPLLEQAFIHSLHTDSPYNLEFRTVWRDGSPHWVSSRGRILRDENGIPLRMLSVMMDITQQKHSEASLRQSHHFLQTVLDNLPVAVTVKDGRPEHFGVYTFWNKTSEKLFGLTAEQAIGKTVYDCFPKEQADLLYQQDQETFNRNLVEEAFEASVNWASSNDSLQASRLLHTVKVPIYDEQHNPRYLLGISEDVTEQKNAEEALKQQAEREALVGAITNDIRQSLDLKQILNTTVAEVRQFLQVDRVLILRFRPSWSGVVLVESVDAGETSLIGKVFPASCFTNSFTDLYQQGQAWAIPDISTRAQTDCYLQFFQELQVQAALTVPIQQQGQLWGLLIAHQCHNARNWQSFEVDLLQQLSSQVGIAIEQSELYQQVQRLNADLERQVQIRTAELQLASEFEATLKRITDRVRDSLDEDQILQTAVRELAVSIGVTGCNAALYDLESRTSKVSYEYTDSVVPLQGRVVQMDNFPEGYQQLMQGQYFQFCSLVPNPMRGYVSLFACPILDDQGVLGDLWLVSQKYRAYNEQDIRLVQQVANQCAIAIRQARLYQKAQAQVKELEKLNRLKDDFLSTVSHELRTPMSNIKMATQMLEVILFKAQTKDIGSDSPKSSSQNSSLSLQKAARYFQILKDECQREINLINDLLDLARLETGADAPNLDVVDLTDWLSQLVQPFFERAHNHQQSLELDLPTTLPPVTTDLSRLERILTELLNNACKYTPAKEKIRVKVRISDSQLQTKTLEETFAASSRRVIASTVLEIAIVNSGVEISPEELTRIFDKFYRIPKNDPWRYGGTGLGLALVKKLLEPLNGVIQATSKQGLTEFMIQLPLSEELEVSHQTSSLI